MAVSRGPALRRGAPARFATPVAATAPDIVPQDAIISQTAIEPSVIARPAIPFVSKAMSPAQLDQPLVEDLDRLWDWARSDREAVASFLSQSHTNSQTFFNQIGQIVGEEQGGTAWLRAVRINGELAGFVMLRPIVKSGAGLAATVHLYFVPKTMNDTLLEVVKQLPSDMTLMMVAPNETFAATFASAGFESKIVLTRPASALTGEPRDRV